MKSTTKKSLKKSEKKEENLTAIPRLSEISSTSQTSSQKSRDTGVKGVNLWNAPNAVDYAEIKLGIKLDDWQKEYIGHEGNTVVRAGRQSGKSFAESLRVALFALLNPKTSTLIIASVDRQSIELLEKVKAQIMGLAPKQIKGRPTFHRIELYNGSKIMAEPAGQTGYGLRGFTVDKLVADEAHYIPDAVFVAIRPMLATTGGTLDLLSTPRGNEGFFYDCFESDDFYKIHIMSKDCPRISDEFLEQERKRMTKLEYCQEYEAEFLDSLQQFFPRELIESCFIKKYIGYKGREYEEDIPKGNTYLGVDFAGHGGDPNAYTSVTNNGKVSFVFEVETKEDEKAWETVNHIIRLTEQHNYKKIGVDDGGLGSPILDFMLTHSILKRKAVGLNNAKREVDRQGKTKQLQGIEMYANLKIMMEQGIVKFSEKNDELIRSLTSIQFIVDKDTKNIKIHGKYDHITEALKRAVWLIKSKGLRLWVR